MVEAHVVQDGVPVEMIVVSVAGNVSPIHFPGRVRAEHHDRLRFVRVLAQMVHDALL